MDLTIEAIEQDLMNAEARAGQPIAAVYLKRAEIRAMLMSMPQQIEAAFVGDEGVAGDRGDESWWTRTDKAIDVHLVAPITRQAAISAAARILGLEDVDLAARLSFIVGAVPDASDVPIDVEDDTDMDDDFFAEAKRERKK